MLFCLPVDLPMCCMIYLWPSLLQSHKSKEEVESCSLQIWRHPSCSELSFHHLSSTPITPVLVAVDCFNSNLGSCLACWQPVPSNTSLNHLRSWARTRSDWKPRSKSWERSWRMGRYGEIKIYGENIETWARDILLHLCRIVPHLLVQQVHEV